MILKVFSAATNTSTL